MNIASAGANATDEMRVITKNLLRGRRTYPCVFINLPAKRAVPAAFAWGE